MSRSSHLRPATGSDNEAEAFVVMHDDEPARNLTRAERETVIRWSDADDLVTIETYSAPVARKCLRLDAFTLVDGPDSHGGYRFTIPTARFSFTQRRILNMTPEQRAERGRRLADARAQVTS